MRGGFRHLNDGSWTGFAWVGLETDDAGRLALATVPLLAEAVALESLPAPAMPLGLTATPSGVAAVEGATGQRILVHDGCGEAALTLPGAPWPDPGDGHPRQFTALAWHGPRGLLLAADAANGVVLLIDPGSGQLLDRWPRGDTPRLDGALALAVDTEGRVIVGEAGRRRLLVFAATGGMPTAIPAPPGIGAWRPGAIAVHPLDGRERLWVLDDEQPRILVLDADGALVRNIALPGLEQPRAMVVSDDGIYLGDERTRRIWRLARDGRRIGSAIGFLGPVAALAIRDADLWVHSGDDPVRRLARRGGHLRRGALWTGPLLVDGAEHDWQRLQAMGTIPAPTRVRFAIRTEPTPPILPVPDQPRFAAPDWQPLATGVADVLVPGPASSALWLGLELSGDGSASPRIAQLRLAFDDDAWLRRLPAIYQRQASGEDLQQLLALVQGGFDDLAGRIDDLARLVDPRVAPADWLPWLASWLAEPLPEPWDEERRRRAIAGAFAALAQRGTRRGLEEGVAARLGIRIHIDEPLAAASWWVLPETTDCCCGAEDCRCGAAGTGASCCGRLGIDTGLAAAEAQGAVLDSSAVTDRSHLIGEDEIGAPLVDELAHRFTVLVHASQARDPRLEQALRRLVGEERPAHTDFCLGVIDATMRIGYQARIGIDSVVAGPPPPGALGSTPITVLGGTPQARLGDGAAIGQGIRIR